MAGKYGGMIEVSGQIPPPGGRQAYRGGYQADGRQKGTDHRPVPLRRKSVCQAAFAFVAYMSTYSCPDSRMTSAITESVTARST